MDGLASNFSISEQADLRQSRAPQTAQRTVRTPIDCTGIGVHSGRRARLGIAPAPAGTGIVFRRSDIGADIPARFDHVVDTRLCTVLGDANDPAVRVGTVEHLMAAFAGCGIDNAIVTVDGPEVPILDGSAAPFVFLLDCAGSVEQDAPRAEIEILRPVRVEDGAAFAELRPGLGGFVMAMAIDFRAEAIGRQSLTLPLESGTFRRDLAPARTFTDATVVAQLHAAGLALGGSLDNAVVVDGAAVLNREGLRMTDEFVRHKLVDAVGDLALAGARLRGRFIGHRSGHALNNRLLRALFADPAAWRATPADTVAALSIAA